MADQDKQLFAPVVPVEKLNSRFQSLIDAPNYDPARSMLDQVYRDFDDPEGNFLEQFQTTGFDARFFELYLFAYFSRSGFEIDRTYTSPDFIVSRNGVSVSVEATTVNPTQGEPADSEPIPPSLNANEFAHFQEQELPIKFGSPLFSKLQKKYWELEQCAGQPFVIAIEAFFNKDSLTYSDSSLAQYLYGLKVSADWTQEGDLEIYTSGVESHMSGKKKIPSNFFAQPGSEHISAVVFTNSGTHAKFARMGYQQGFGNQQYEISRTGLCYNLHPDAKDATYFSYSLSEPPFVESWGQGLVVNHNPNALFPLPMDFIPEAVQGYIEDGVHKAEHPGWHPIMSTTRILHFPKPGKHQPSVPRAFVAAISKSEFASTCGFALDSANPILAEEGWFIDEAESFLGVLVRDKIDEDWGYVILARDQHFQFRAIDTAASMTTRDEARGRLQLAIAAKVADCQRIFPQ